MTLVRLLAGRTTQRTVERTRYAQASGLRAEEVTVHPVVETLLVFGLAAVVVLLFRLAAAQAEREEEEESWEVRDDDGNPDLLRRIDDRD